MLTFELPFALAGFIIPVLGFVWRKDHRYLLSFLSMLSCAIYLLIELYGVTDMIAHQDWIALEDTMLVIFQLPAFVLFMTVMINIFVLRIATYRFQNQNILL